MFVLSIITLILAGVAFIIGLMLVSRKGTEVEDRYGNKHREDDYSQAGRWTMLGGVAGVLLAGVFFVFSAMFTQDVGEARVLRDWTGEIVGEVTEPGLHWKAPWVDAIEFDIRNQPAIFIEDGTDSYNGQAPNGPQITFQDKEGVTGNLDIVVIYSIKPDSVTDIYRQYSSQENFRTRLIEQDIRSIPRDVASRYTTLQMFTNRTTIAAAIQDELAERWTEQGVIVDSVSLQEIRYSGEVQSRFDAAQQARIDVETSKANLEKSRVDAEQAIVRAEADAKARIAAAEGEAEANRILSESLTEKVLRQRYLDTLASLAAAGNLVITDGTGSQILVQK